MQRRRGPGGRAPHTAEETREWRTLERSQRAEPDADPANHLAARVGLARLQARRRAVNRKLAAVRSEVGARVRAGTERLGGNLAAAASRVGGGMATTATTMGRVMNFAGRAGRVLGATTARGLGTGAELLSDGAVATARATGKGLLGIARLPSRAVDLAMMVLPGDGGAGADRYDRAVRSVERDRRRGLDLRNPTSPPSSRSTWGRHPARPAPPRATAPRSNARARLKTPAANPPKTAPPLAANTTTEVSRGDDNPPGVRSRDLPAPISRREPRGGG